jgi:hypothetical protein
MRERSRWAFFNSLLNEGGEAGSPETAGAEGEGAHQEGDAPEITFEGTGCGRIFWHWPSRVCRNPDVAGFLNF